MNYIDLLDEIKAPVLEKEKALYSAKKAFQDIKDDISWYKKYNPAVDKIKAEKAKEKLLVLEKKLNKSKKDIALVEEQLEDVKECVIRWWQKINPVVFVYSLFSTEQKKYKNIEQELKERRKFLKGRIVCREWLISDNREIIEKFEQDNEKFNNFNLEETLIRQACVETDIVTKEKEYQQLSDHYTFICNQIQPLVDKINEMIDKSNEMQENIEKAEGLEDELNYVVNSYDRAMIHQKCKNEFGDGSPRKVIAHFTGVNERLQKDIEILDNKICCEIRKIR